MRLDYISKLKTSEFIRPNRFKMLIKLTTVIKWLCDYYSVLILPIFSSQLICSLLSNIKPNYPQLDSHKIWIMPVKNKKYQGRLKKSFRRPFILFTQTVSSANKTCPFSDGLGTHRLDLKQTPMHLTNPFSTKQCRAHGHDFVRQRSDVCRHWHSR